MTKTQKETAIWDPSTQTEKEVIIPAVEVTTPKVKVSKTKQKYLNPKTGKMVGYVRAKNLGLV